MDSNEVSIIELQQVPVIIERLQLVKSEVINKTTEACALVCTDETYKDIKKVRAELTKQFKALEEQRKALKSAIMKPYEEFERVYKECITIPFTSADSELKEKIAEVENGLKAEKAAQVRAFYDELVSCVSVPWLKTIEYNPEISLSVSVKKLKEETSAYVNRICADVRTINTLEYAPEIIVEYRANGFNIAAAIATVNERHAAIEAQAQAEAAAALLREEEEKHAAEVINTAEAERPAEVITEPPQQSIYETRFFVRGTIEQLKALKEFLNNGGYEYGSV